jgi:hypothetical protein
MRTLTFLLLSCWLVTGAAAAPATVAILPVETADTTVAQRLMQALQAGVSSAPDLENKGPVSMSLDEARMAYSCFEGQPECMAQVGASLGADRLIWGRFALDPDTNRWVLALYLVDVAEKREIRQARLDAKGPDDFPFLAEAAQTFVRGIKIKAATAPLEVRSKPSDAEVRIDGALAGRTPLKAEVEPGMRQITVTKAGYLAEDRVLRVRGEGGIIDLDLARDVDVEVATATTGGGFGKREWISIGLLSAGAVSLGVAGITKLREGALYEKANNAVVDTPERDKAAADFDSNSSIHLRSFIVGGVLIAGAIGTWFLMPESPAAKKKVSGPQANLSVGPGGVLVFGSF